METITLEVARDLLRRAVETQGRDFVYNTDNGKCFYGPMNEHSGISVAKTKTGCIVGTALTIHGVDVSNFGQAPVYNLGGGSVYTTLRGVLTENAAKYFRVAQISQDEGNTWGQAYFYAEVAIAENGWS